MTSSDIIGAHEVVELNLRICQQSFRVVGEHIGLHLLRGGFQCRIVPLDHVENLPYGALCPGTDRDDDK